MFKIGGAATAPAAVSVNTIVKAAATAGTRKATP
jgi:hypothetical protein